LYSTGAAIGRKQIEDTWFVKGAFSMYRSCVIHIAIQYLEGHTEVLPDDMESAEVAIEGEVSPILAELFGGEILVDDVTVEGVQTRSTPYK